jgi:hypothetical protein
MDQELAPEQHRIIVVYPVMMQTQIVILILVQEMELVKLGIC